MTEDKIDIKSLNFTELQKLLEEMGEKKFRAKQLYEWIHKRLVLSFDEMTNLSKDMRKKLKAGLGYDPIVNKIGEGYKIWGDGKA